MIYQSFFFTLLRQIFSQCPPTKTTNKPINTAPTKIASFFELADSLISGSKSGIGLISKLISFQMPLQGLLPLGYKL